MNDVVDAVAQMLRDMTPVLQERLMRETGFFELRAEVITDDDESVSLFVEGENTDGRKVTTCVVWDNFDEDVLYVIHNLYNDTCSACFVNMASATLEDDLVSALTVRR